MTPEMELSHIVVDDAERLHKFFVFILKKGRELEFRFNVCKQ